MLRARIAVVGLLTVAAATFVAVEEHRVSAAENRAAESALKVVNDSAAADSTHRLDVATNATLRQALGDTVQMFQRLVVQTAQRSDAVDRALERERIGRYALGLQLDSLQRRAIAVVTADTADRVRRAEFDVRQPPYTVAAAVELPPAPDTARLALRVALDPIPVVARLSCAPPNRDGIRAASIEAQSPPWASIRFHDVQQSPDLCASPALTHAVGRSLVKFKLLMIGGGRVVLPDGVSRWGAFVGSGFAFWST